MSKHTAGPWHVCKAPTMVSDSRNRMVATVGFRRSEEEIANARLIAAAPELLAALKDILACEYSGYIPSKLADPAKAAIAKAAEPTA